MSEPLQLVLGADQTCYGLGIACNLTAQSHSRGGYLEPAGQHDVPCHPSVPSPPSNAPCTWHSHASSLDRAGAGDAVRGPEGCSDFWAAGPIRTAGADWYWAALPDQGSHRPGQAPHLVSRGNVLAVPSSCELLAAAARRRRRWPSLWQCLPPPHWPLPACCRLCRNERFTWLNVNPAYSTEMSVKVLNKNVVSPVGLPIYTGRAPFLPSPCIHICFSFFSLTSPPPPAADGQRRAGGHSPRPHELYLCFWHRGEAGAAGKPFPFLLVLPSQATLYSTGNPSAPLFSLAGSRLVRVRAIYGG